MSTTTYHHNGEPIAETKPSCITGLHPTMVAAPVKTVYRVTYYDKSRGGVWRRDFAERADAEAFAVGRRVYARPARVVAVEVAS